MVSLLGQCFGVVKNSVNNAAADDSNCNWKTTDANYQLAEPPNSKVFWSFLSNLRLFQQLQPYKDFSGNLDLCSAWNAILESYFTAVAALKHGPRGSYHDTCLCNIFSTRGRFGGKICFASFTKIIFVNGSTPASFSFIFGLLQTNINTILHQIKLINVISIQYRTPGFEPMTSRTWVVSRNH